MIIKRRQHDERQADVERETAPAPEGETLTPEHWNPLREELGAILGVDPDELRPRD